MNKYMHLFSKLPDGKKNKIQNIIIIFAVLFGIFFWFYGSRPFVVNGLSMFPTFNTGFSDGELHILSGDYLFIDIFSYNFIVEPGRYDVIVAKSPIENNRFILKRIIGLPGDTIKLQKNTVEITAPDGEIFILDEPYLNEKETIVYKKLISTLGSEEYFIMGDNRQNSLDSRSWGVLPKNNIVGRVLGRIYPFKEAEFFPGTIDKLRA